MGILPERLVGTTEPIPRSLEMSSVGEISDWKFYGASWRGPWPLRPLFRQARGLQWRLRGKLIYLNQAPF
jgi:hypothetical protein